MTKCCLEYYKLTVLLTYIIVYRYSETKAMHFLFNLLRIKSLHMFRALLAHSQVARDVSSGVGGAPPPPQETQPPTTKKNENHPK
jgi:hypothetical protein